MLWFSGQPLKIIVQRAKVQKKLIFLSNTFLATIYLFNLPLLFKLGTTFNVGHCYIVWFKEAGR